MNTVTAKQDLLESCKEREYRDALNVENVYGGICAQIRALREQREMSQAQLGRKANMAQERISILEDPNAETKPTLNTMLRIASAFDVGLDVRFVPFSTVLDRSTNTNQRSLEVESFDDELPAIEKDLAVERALIAAHEAGLSAGLSVSNLSDIYDYVFRGATAYSPKTKVQKGTWAGQQNIMIHEARPQPKGTLVFEPTGLIKLPAKEEKALYTGEEQLNYGT